MPISNYQPSSRLTQSGVCTSATRPNAPYEGQIIYETDTDRFLVWNNSAWVIPNSTTQNPSGLEKITPSSVSGTGVTLSNGTVTIASGGTFAIIEGCFSSTYVNYLLQFSNVTFASGAAVRLNLRVGGSNAVTDYYWAGGYTQYSGTPTFVGENGAGSTNGWTTPVISDNVATAGGSVFLYNPFLSKQTTYYSFGSDSRTSGTPRFPYSGYHNVATSYTSLQLTNNSAVNFGSCILNIYGYRN